MTKLMKCMQVVSVLMLVNMGSRVMALDGVLGVRVGLDVGYNHGKITVPGEIIPELMHGSSASFGSGIYFDLGLLSWLAVSAGMHVQVARQLQESIFGLQMLKAQWHDFVLDALLKFRVQWWYLGMGLGVVFQTKAQMSLLNLHWKTQNSQRLLYIFETGLNIPISIVQLQLALRSTFTPKVLTSWLSHKGNAFGSAFNVGFYLGVGFKLF
jgi:hypothetical protein